MLVHAESSNRRRHEIRGGCREQVVIHRAPRRQQRLPARQDIVWNDELERLTVTAKTQDPAVFDRMAGRELSVVLDAADPLQLQ